MGRNIFLGTLTLIAGFCLGIICVFSFIEPSPPLQPADTSPISPSISVTPSPVPTPSAEVVPTAEVFAPQADLSENRVLLEHAYQVLDALKTQDYQALSTYVHPVDGVIFTPYSTVDLSANLCFTSVQVASLGSDSTKYVWGISDGKGDPLTLTVQEYFARYVYNADYAQAPMLGIDRIIGSGNALENVFEVFPDSRFVEFYFPGIAPEYNGFDWCGLKLVFSEHNNAYKLVAVIHSEWTI